jgi:hypothetical protein
MSDVRDADSNDESEFGLGTGMMDAVQRADGRDALPVHQQQWEIMALPKTFDGSMPDRADAESTPVPRLLPGESESDRA